MRTIRLLALLAIAALSSATRLAAQCMPQFNISVYSDEDVSPDGLTVYGYSSAEDSSTLCTCVHSGYQTTAYLEAPDGSLVDETQSGETSSVSTSNDDEGAYSSAGVVTLNCSCAGGLGAVDPPGPAIYPNGIVDYVTDSTTVYPGVSSYFEIYGTALTAWGETPTPTVTGDSDVTINFVSYASDGQVNVSYTVAANPTTMGAHNISLQTKSGTAKRPVTIGCATPVNFRIYTPGQDIGGGYLQLVYTWDSSTGNRDPNTGIKNDLQACTLREVVNYPGPDPFPFPAPFPTQNANPDNPTYGSRAGVRISRHPQDARHIQSRRILQTVSRQHSNTSGSAPAPATTRGNQSAASPGSPLFAV